MTITTIARHATPWEDKIYQVRTRNSGTVTTTLHKVKTGDGCDISVSHLAQPGARDAVLLIHGLTTSSDMFVMPEHYNMAAYLHDHGFDVWLADFRMSNHFAYNTTHHFTFDDIAFYDWPAVVGLVRGSIGTRPLHVVAHCLGSATFHMALYGKTISGITSVVSNSISLNPRVHPWAAFKLGVAPFLVDKVLHLSALDPRWSEEGNRSMPWIGRLLARVNGLVHLECNNDACNLVSFIWGSGFPAIFEHSTMSRITHGRLTELFGPVAMSYFRCVRAGLVRDNTFGRISKNPALSRLPERYIDNVGDVVVPTLFLSGVHNHIFPGANKLTAELIAAKGIAGYEYREIPGYGHQDVFMGERCETETFPLMLNFLDRVAAAGIRP